MKTYSALSMVKVDGKTREIDHSIEAESSEEAEVICDAFGWYYLGETEILLRRAGEMDLAELVALYEKGTLH